MNKQEMKDLVCRKVDEYKDMIEGIATYLHEHPELGMKEVLAAAYLRQVLQGQGFALSDVMPDKFPTAFHAVKGQGSLQMGFLAEYDALPGIGHGCGHNLIAAMSIGAAAAFAAVAPEQAVVHLFGCPAEETVSGKAYMAEAGVFDELDGAVIVHPAEDTAIGGTSYASHPTRFTFIGKEAHVADPDYHGINALSALVDFYGKLETLNKTFEEPHVIGAIITEGGKAPNIIPARAVMKATVRALDAHYLEGIMLPQIRQLAQDVADAHGAEVEIVHYEPLLKNMLNDPRMDVYFAENFNLLHEQFTVKADDYAAGSTDVGNVSHIIRVSQPEIGIGGTEPAHTPGFAAAAIAPYAKMQALTGAKAMAMVAVDMLFEEKNM